MSRTNYEAVSGYFGHWALTDAFDRLLTDFSSVKSSESHCSRATSENTLVRAWLSRSPTDCDTYLRKLAPKRGWCV